MWFRQSGRAPRSFSILHLLGNAEIQFDAAFFCFTSETGMVRFPI
jgi:hypothetical protein